MFPWELSDCKLVRKTKDVRVLFHLLSCVSRLLLPLKLAVVPVTATEENAVHFLSLEK